MKNMCFIFSIFFSMSVYVCFPMHASDKQFQKHPVGASQAHIPISYMVPQGSSLNPIELSESVPQRLVTVQAHIIDQRMEQVLANFDSENKRIEGLINHYNISAPFAPLEMVKKKYLEDTRTLASNKLNRLNAIKDLLSKNKNIITLPEDDYKIFLQYVLVKPLLPFNS